MNNKCADCSAPLAANQMQCAFCGVVQKDFNEQLLTELMAIRRKYQLARVSGNKLIVDQLLADEYTDTYRYLGEDDEPMPKEVVLANLLVLLNKDFASYSFGSEELIEITNDKATISCVETVLHHSSNLDKYYSDITRSRVTFVWREGRWLIASEYGVAIDKNGNEIV